ncbi:OmpA family protein [Sulfuriflexus mobilis]|uniref:OmpA family protein n=1 Tax=Sulfuriflexus mobilis TaxID=1811807 RepID=UPI000F830E11|nr:OmpA family protein [Sulfuriflexus mobilis]
MRKFMFNALFTVCITLLASPAYALEGILLDRQGQYVTDGFGECVSIDKLKHFHKDGGIKYCADEAKKMAEPAPAPAPAPQVIKKNVSLGAHALFNHDRSNLRPEGKRELDALAARLKSFSSVRGINVVGHTDSQGTDAYNQGLSERRAASVRQYLISKGVNGNVITASGKGESSPVASNATKEGRQQNRRVEIGIRAVE